jgi:hypothetical protein
MCVLKEFGVRFSPLNHLRHVTPFAFHFAVLRHIYCAAVYLPEYCIITIANAKKKNSEDM